MLSFLSFSSSFFSSFSSALQSAKNTNSVIINNFMLFLIFRQVLYNFSNHHLFDVVQFCLLLFFGTTKC